MGIVRRLPRFAFCPYQSDETAKRTVRSARRLTFRGGAVLHLHWTADVPGEPGVDIRVGANLDD
jgi:hypothetical protein